MMGITLSATANACRKERRNKDITTRLLVNEGVGEELKDQILKTKEELVTVLILTY
jgi:hypothetical protein